MNCDGLFQPETLSFDSNLDSLIDANFDTDIELPFPSHSQMSALVNEGVDLDSEGGGGVESAHDLVVTSEQPEESISSSHDTVNEQFLEQNLSIDNCDTAVDDDWETGAISQVTQVKSTKDDCLLVSNLETENEQRTNVTNIHNIEHLNLTSLKEKRKKKLAESAKNKPEKKNTDVDLSQQTKPGSSDLSHAKKRKYVESSETSEIQNDTSKKFKDLNNTTTADISQIKLSERNKNVMIENEMNLNKDLNSLSPDSSTDIKVVSVDTDLNEVQGAIIEDCDTEKRSKEVTSFEECSADVVDEETVEKLDRNQDVLNCSESTITENEENEATLKETEISRANTPETAAVHDYDDLNDVEDDDSDDEFDENEVDAMLEEGVVKDRRKTEREVTSEKDLGNGNYMTKLKYILQEKGSNPFEVLPEGWVMVVHNSGMPVYLHKLTRVCTMSRPYFLGQGSVRKHEIPISAVPCLQYKRELDKEEKREQAELVSSNSIQNQPTDGDASIELPTPVVATAEAVDKEVVLHPGELYSYCKSLFQFKTITIKKFQTWREKRNHLREKYEQERKLPKMAADTKLIVCPIPESVSKTFSKKKKDFVINPEGKSAVCILHEYTQHVIRVQPVYTFSEIENQETPYKATIMIDNVGYGSGVGSCKKKAKLEAAKSALKVFIPQLAEYWKEMESKTQNIDLSYFEEVAIEDPRVTTLCDKAALPKPYQVLSECLKRNFGMGDTNLRIEKKLVSNQKTEFSLTVGKHKATVVCKNKLEGKQKAAQCMLQKLHPQLKSWASILRLYSKNTEVGFQEREEEIPEASGMKDNQLLEKLKEAMRKSKAMKGQMNTSTLGYMVSAAASQHLDL